jgi:AcrR family transcriptional regulator
MGTEAGTPEAEMGRRRTVKPKGERRQDILDAALELFVENGFEDTTVQQIAARAGVAAGTVYLYFGSKRDVLLGLHEEFHQGMEERFLETTGDFLARREDGQDLDYTQAVDEALDSMVAYSLEHRTACEVIARHLSQAGLTDEAMLAERRFADFLARAFETGVEEGLIQVSDPQMAAYLLSAAVSFTLGRAIAYGDPPDLDRLVAQAKELYHKALAPPSG